MCRCECVNEKNLVAVTEDGLALQYIKHKDQSEAVKLAATKNL